MRNIRWVWPVGYVIIRSLATLLFDYKIVNRHRANTPGGALIVCNHQSYLDPPLLGLVPNRAPYFLGRKTLFKKSVAWFYYGAHTVPVDLEGSSMEGIRIILNLIKQGKQVVIFPEGQRCFDGKLQEAKPGVGLLVAKSKVPVIPMRLFGAHSCLPRGSKHLQRGPITCVVGEPVDFSQEEFSGNKREAYRQISDRLMEEIAKIKLPEDCRHRHLGSPDLD